MRCLKKNCPLKKDWRSCSDFIAGTEECKGTQLQALHEDVNREMGIDLPDYEGDK